MAQIRSKTLFLTTSPRTPEKMIPEIKLLEKHFSGEVWNKSSQSAFMEILREEQFFNGKGENDPGFSARDRINRAPKSLGLVRLSPRISLTPAGQALIESKNKHEVLLRQMLKFQLPSPFHKPTIDAANFCIKPYLELIRLVRRLGTLRFDELQMFGMQLTNWHDFEKIVQKIEQFRRAKATHKGGYRTFKRDYFFNELSIVFADRIAKGETTTRESKDASLNKFLCTQLNNMRDYADACFRYLRATGLVNVSHVGKSLSIVPERIEDVDYILQTVSRDPCFVDNEESYITYLGSAKLPLLLTDNKQKLLEKLHTMAGGQKQYETEGEPVSRHLGKLKTSTNKPCYGLFVAPAINEACVAHFYALHKMNISFYGGESVIVPLPLNLFQKMVEDSYKADYEPNASQVKSFFEFSKSLASQCNDEQDWYAGMKERALNWLNN